MKAIYYFVTLLFLSAFAKGQQALTAPCKPFLLPAVEYNYNSTLKHGIGLGIKVVQAYKGSDCGGPLGGLSYLLGPTYRLNGGYYPATKSGNVSLSAGYRFIFLYAEASAGYSSSARSELNADFFHFGPTLGVDMLVAQVNLGYSFRTESIQNKRGAFTLSVVFSPVALNGGKKLRKVKTAVSSTSEERKSLREERKKQ